MEKPKVTPYRTRTGIEIGKFYVPPSNMQQSYDMELLQESLLTDDISLRRRKIQNLAYAWALGALVLFLIVVK
jgi:hypothetical protein